MNTMNQAPNVPYMDIKNEDLLKKIDQDDKRMLNYIGRLYKAISGDTLNIDEIENAVDALSVFNQRQEYNYLNNLIHPEKCKGVKLPSPIPVPSAAFQLHNSITLSTNSSGNLGIVFNPFFLYEKGTGVKQPGTLNGTIPVTGDNDWVNGSGNNAVALSCNYLSSFWVNNDNALAGNAAGQGKWKAVNIGQGIPNVYDQYRLVSASIVIKYIGRIDIVSGVIGGAIVFDENRYIGVDSLLAFSSETTSGNVGNPVNPALSKYSNFDLAMDSFYQQEQLCLEGCRELYFPVDNTFEEYMKLLNQNYIGVEGDPKAKNTDNVYLVADQDYYKSGFNYMIYVLGAPANTACFKVDIYCNFECLPNAEFLNYMPISLSPHMISPADKAYAIKQTQNIAIQKAESEYTKPSQTTSMWKKLKNAFGATLPSIAKMVTQGLMDSIPGMKVVQAVTGTVLNSLLDAKRNSMPPPNINPSITSSMSTQASSIAQSVPLYQNTPY